MSEPSGEYDLSSLPAFISDYCFKTKSLHYVRLLNACNKYMDTSFGASIDSTSFSGGKDLRTPTEIFSSPLTENRTELFKEIHALHNNRLIVIDDKWMIHSTIAKL